MEAGVPGVPDSVFAFPRYGGSEFCRNLCDSENRSPKLFRPAVDVEVRPDGAICGEDWRSTSLTLFNEPMVEDRPLEPRNGGGMDVDGVEFPDRCDVTESLRKRDAPGKPKGGLVGARLERVGDGNGDRCLGSDPPRRSDRCGALGGSLSGGGFLAGDTDVRRLREVLAVLFPSTFDSGGEDFSGRGNKGLLSFFRRGKRKKVVVVETVCVVVVSA